MARQTIYLGRPFTIVRPPSGEKELYVANFDEAPFDFLKCTIQNSTSYSPPDAFVTDSVNKIIKVKGFDGVPNTASMELIVQGVRSVKTVNVIEEKKVLLSDETLQAVKDAPKAAAAFTYLNLKRSFWAFMFVSFILFIIKGTSFGDKVNEVWSWFNAARVINIAENFDMRIASNKHPVYETSEFTAINARYKERFGDDKDLRNLYHFAGNTKIENGHMSGYFITGDLIMKGGKPWLVSKGKAEDYCEVMGGVLPTRAELKTFLAQQYVGIDNFVWPIKRRNTEPEWSSDDYSWLFNSWIYLKEGGENSTGNEVINGFVKASDSTKAAFRCSFYGHHYIAEM
jgi:hypothetical protein